MKKKKTNEIIGNVFRVSAALLLIYMSASGNYINGGLYSDSQILLYGLIDFLIISLACIIIPLIWRIINGEKFACEYGKKICKWNSIMLFSLSLVISIIVFNGNGFGIGGLGAAIYYFINKWLFVDETKNEVKKKRKNQKSNKWEINICTK